MAKFCLNYDSGNYEWIEENGFSVTQGRYIENWDRSAYRREEEEEEYRRETSAKFSARHEVEENWEASDDCHIRI